MKFKITLHAEAEMNRRGIPRMLVEAVLDKPQQIVEEYGNKKAYQSKIDFGKGIIYLLRVIVDDTVTPKSVVTVYRTSKIEKYWRPS
jgi:hypothetical protein